MAHEKLQLIAKTLELKRKNKKQKILLQKVYTITDEYNKFVKDMDKQLDDIILQLESITEDEH